MIKSYKKFFYGVLLSLLFVNLSTSYAYYTSDVISVNDVGEILDFFGITNDTGIRNGYATQLNNLIRNENLNKMNMVFVYFNQLLYVVPANGTIGNDYAFLYVFQPDYSNKVYIRQWDSTIFSGDNTIVGFNYSLIPTAYVVTRYGIQTQSNVAFDFTYNQDIISGDNSQFVDFPKMLATFPTHNVASYSWYIGEYNWRFLKNYKYLSTWEEPEPEPTPTETPTPTPSGGGGNVDLTNVEIGIADIKDNIHNLNVDMNRQANEIKNKIPTSGDIQNATVGAMTDYWGSSGDLDGEDQEDEIENNINNLIDNVSGELTQNEAYNQLNEIENGFLNFFDQNHDEEWYDLIVKWDNIDLNISKRRDKPSRKLFYTKWRNQLLKNVQRNRRTRDNKNIYKSNI